MHCDGTMYNMIFVPKLPLLITAEQGESWNILKIWHLPTQTVLETICIDQSIKEIVCEKLLSKVHLLLGDESTVQLRSIDFLNVDLFNELRLSTNQLKELYCQAVVHRSVEKVLEEIPCYKELLKKCQPKMKVIIEKVLKDSKEEVSEEFFFQPSFWQRHKRKIIGGVGIAAGASIIYGLYSWYYSR